jgi:hypothetical protein
LLLQSYPRIAKEGPIFDYETDLVKNLEEHRSVWIKKSRGLGVTEIIKVYFIVMHKE